MIIIRNLLGIVMLFGVLYLVSNNKVNINKKLIIKAFAIQFVVAILLVKVPLGRVVIQNVSDGVSNVLNYGSAGLNFIFGSLADGAAPTGMVFGIQVLGNIIFVSALVSALFYLGVLGLVIKIIGGAIGKVIGTSKVESFVAVANMFLGQTDSPLLVSKYLPKMTESEIMLVLVSGMGSMSVSVIMGYVGLGIPMEYLLIGSTLVPLGSIIISKILIPEAEVASEIENLKIDNKGDNENLISAISEGASAGLNMALGIGAVLIAIVALVAMLNGFLGIFGVSLEGILGYAFAPIGYLMGVPNDQVLLAGQLLGSKMALNEFVAFGQLGKVISTLDYRTGLMLAVSLTGFANISSMGICVSGISVFCPDKRGQLSKLAFRGMIGGFCVSILSALIVGLIIAI
ncbi:NupC/NupG family nucleoside CNT transporter [Clostridium sp. CM028]|uniref:NupC/NupG family nucleoside CNT transporter n=1 Tax=unclassified Clostridium TaxID=2614128 RepID=UPI001C0D0A82|nr:MULTISPECIES: nucleoside transporter C-terminal domain-containing protein [unclassified Clostridium]MBU3092891.1 NupC/NupG family nucleoside CNT transporter [Clostridium sp. CF011]MBW9146638.1 NupC/NupG family nucleoside CNT transporter [Clostridium sp. CM027]MBW9149077.1 NupC/NupG family nucleoside CNT transporter [Clostridium sp. CM028]UVE42042.1 NupC/NupG family nucleoside CNT transporter [Clostridium sp. CM027]WAG71065.1 NupC/NupG family nucleoside CNT transporter [Clostridium sp. CF011